jgi:osmotically inducible protein OsmC
MLFDNSFQRSTQLRATWEIIVVRRPGGILYALLSPITIPLTLIRNLIMTAKVLFTGTTHTSGGPDGATRSTDGQLDLRLPEPHPAAEKLFGAAWSACFIGAIELVASQKKIALPTHPSITATIEMLMENNAFFLKAHLDVSIPDVDREVAQQLMEAAHGVCPYSKASRGNIEVKLTLA